MNALEFFLGHARRGVDDISDLNKRIIPEPTRPRHPLLPPSAVRRSSVLSLSLSFVLVFSFGSEILSKTLTQQTGSGMAQLCMWQLVVGFNLREMEAREDMRKNFNK